MVAPAGVPQAIINNLSAEGARIVQLPDVAHRFELRQCGSGGEHASGIRGVSES
ncbi:MAG: hypothetical protein V4637_11410 [Pseudomonadota bacterium]